MILRKIKEKDGAAVLTLVIILMLMFPLIISGLIDMTNCTLIKRNLKQNLNMASKAAANTVDMPATRNGVYRIKDGILYDKIYDFNDYEGKSKYTTSIGVNGEYKYYDDENDAAKVFYSFLTYNNLIDYKINEANSHYSYSYITSENTNPITGQTEKYVRINYKQPKDYSNGKRESEYSFIIINNDYPYATELAQKNPVAVNRDMVSLSNDNIGISQIYGSSSETTLDGRTLKVNACNPTVVSVGVVKYELSPIFRIIGKKEVYLKEYSTSELIMNDDYWE